MAKSTQLKIGNSLLALSMITQALTGFFMYSAGDLFPEIHEINAWVLLGLLAIHLALNWGWIKANVLKRKPAVNP